MRIELNQGTYQIRPSVGAKGGARPVDSIRSASPSSPSTPATSRNTTPAPNTGGAVRSAESTSSVMPVATTTIVRGPDVAEFSTIDFATARQDLPKIDQYHAKMRNLVAGQVARPISFGAGPTPKGRTIYDRAYLKQVADHASLNAAAVERKQIDLRG